MLNGWVERYYIQPKLFFPYFGFSWVHPLPGLWMYLPFMLIAVCAVCIILGLYFRPAVFLFLFLFTYTEVIDITNYLNHHYLIFLLSVLMCCLPMNAAYSLDARRKGYITAVPQWCVYVLQLQIGLVYFFAGIAKIKYSWLIDAQPMKIWLGACSGIPLIGRYLGMVFTAYLFSWAGMLFDISAPFLLCYKRTRPVIYVLIIFFHSLTSLLFYIGLFPLIMTTLALIFFPGTWHGKILERFFGKREMPVGPTEKLIVNKIVLIFLPCFFLVQFLLPLRHLLYRGNVLWTEEGFRYSWNVMLMEKSGLVEFYVKDKNSGKERLILPAVYLTKQQLRMMSTQPDMILQFAHYLAGEHKKATGHDAEVRVECYASLNGKGSRLLINATTDLAKECESFAAKKWITAL